LNLAGNTETCWVTREGFRNNCAFIPHGIHACASGSCIIDWVSEATLTIFSIFLIVLEDNSTIISARYLEPAKESVLRLTIHLHAFRGISCSVRWRGIPAIHVVLAFEIACASLEWTFLPGAETTEGPVDCYTAIATSLAILVWVAIFIFDQAKALTLLALLSDTLNVLTTISTRVEKRPVGPDRDALLLDLAELYLRIEVNYRS
jgi:hypothetical protein